ncbi:MAG: hypothetical protein CMJ31_12865 [Phycisphaerae bacterium]|nr:hypothetical protein [Phycisphaerae bacterium]
MRLSDLFADGGLTFFPIVGLLIFFGVFVAVGFRVMRKGRTEMNHNARLPLEDGAVAATRGERSGQ